MATHAESGESAADLDGFRRSLGEYVTGVTIVTTKCAGDRYGMTSNSFASVSLRPPMILWSLRRESTSFRAFESCEHFAVSVLAEHQIELSQRFAKSGPGKFEGVAFSDGIGGAPVLADVAASFECSRTATFDGGDHLIMLGTVLRHHRFDRQPLAFSKGRYGAIAEHPSARLNSTASAPLDGMSGDSPLASLMVQAYGVFAAHLQKDREAVGLGLSQQQARLLMAAQTHPGSTLEKLLPELLLDFNGGQGVLDTLVSMNLVVLDGDRVMLTAAGEARIDQIVEHTRSRESKLFDTIEPQSLVAMRSVLQSILAKLG